MKILTPEQLATFWKVSLADIEKYRRYKKMPFHSAGYNKYVYVLSEVEAWKNSPTEKRKYEFKTRKNKIELPNKGA
jgi:hypothetical protein